MQSQSLEQATIRVATAADAGSIADIYNHYITDTVVTFEEQPVSPAEMTQRINEVALASLPWLVAERGDQILGYAYASKWRGRCAYRFSAEITVYLGQDYRKLGIGSRLYSELFPLLAGRGIHAVIGGIALPNPASIALHERFGLEKVAHFREVGFKFGKWIDVGYWHRIL